MMPPKCECVVDWQCTPEGDRGDEIECGADAKWKAGAVLMCEECAAACIDEQCFSRDELVEL